MIDVDALTVRFKTVAGAVDAVRDASFHVAQGEVFGLVGESGSGKSTILRALSGLTPIAQGTVLALRSRAVSRKSALCKWCFRTHTARCIHASLSIRHCANRCVSTASASMKNVSSMRCVKSGSMRRFDFAIHISYRVDSGNAWRLRAR
jgi:ABC-type dipeptide/oligopeptide/nickel transport system ATPase subunit